MALKIQHLLACKEFGYLLYSRHIQHLVRSYVAIAISSYVLLATSIYIHVYSYGSTALARTCAGECDSPLSLL